MGGLCATQWLLAGQEPECGFFWHKRLCCNPARGSLQNPFGKAEAGDFTTQAGQKQGWAQEVCVASVSLQAGVRHPMETTRNAFLSFAARSCR